MITYLKDENLDELTKDKKVLIDFYADWCMPCNMLGESIEEIVDEDKNVNVVKINVDEHPALAREYGVMSIPLLLLSENSKTVKKHVGLMEKEELVEWMK